MDGRSRPIDDAYVLPRDPGQVERLDVQHVAIREAMKGNHLAPIIGPGRILDVGCGTGQWAYEICAEFPDSMVVGLDLTPSKPSPPPNYRYVEGNLLQGLPFAGGQFDFVHQRLLISGIPLRDWPGEVAELVRVTRRGGWIELFEAFPGVSPEGPATRRLWDVFRQLGRAVGHDTFGHVFRSLDRYLAEAGAVGLVSHTVVLPIGEWGGRVGAWMARDVRSLFGGLVEVFQTAGLTETECRELIDAMFGEFEELHASIRNRVVVGCRPA